jgi:hypothetical protein
MVLGMGLASSIAAGTCAERMLPVVIVLSWITV